MEQSSLLFADEPERENAAVKAMWFLFGRHPQDARCGSCGDFTAATIRLVLLAEAFTTDDVWDQLDSQGVTTHDTRALEAVMKAMQKCGLIEATTTFLPSSHTINHHRTVRVWRATQVA